MEGSVSQEVPAAGSSAFAFALEATEVHLEPVQLHLLPHDHLLHELHLTPQALDLVLIRLLFARQLGAL